MPCWHEDRLIFITEKIVSCWPATFSTPGRSLMSTWPKTPYLQEGWTSALATWRSTSRGVRSSSGPRPGEGSMSTSKSSSTSRIGGSTYLFGYYNMDLKKVALLGWVWKREWADISQFQNTPSPGDDYPANYPLSRLGSRWRKGGSTLSDRGLFEVETFFRSPG